MSPRKYFAIIFAVSLLGAHAAPAAISFFEAENGFAISPQPESLSVADVNGDGLEDVVVISRQSDEVNVMLARPDQPSRFSRVGVDEFGTTLRLGVAADVTRDDVPDLVVADQGQDGVWVLVGAGDGRLLEPTFFPIGRNPYAIAIADFDNQRGPDIAVTDQRLDNVTILLNDGGSPPRFTRGPIFQVGDEPLSILAIDVNGDGEEDLVTLNEGGPRVKSISVLIFDDVRAGLPVFESNRESGVGANPSSLNGADLNNDGLVDLIMLNRPTGGGNSETNVLISAGDGTFIGPSIASVPCPFFTGGAICRARTMTTGDFDGNGTIDIAVFQNDPRRVDTGSGINNDAISIFAGRGDGEFLAGPVLRSPKSPISAVAADLDNDGRPDIVAGFQRATNITAFINASTPGGSANGEPCAVGGTCLSGICVEGHCCASSCNDGETCAAPEREGTCVRIPPVIPCDFDVECFDIPNEGDDGMCIDNFCCEDACFEGRCDIAGFEGLCIPTRPDGAECSDERNCESTFCVDGVCCKESCDDGFCGNEQGVCQPPVELGGPCLVDGECVSDICDEFDLICCSERCETDTQFCNEEGNCTVFGETPTPSQPGDSCDDGGDCTTGNCVNSICCTVDSCPAGEACQPPNGVCAIEPTATPTPVPQSPGAFCDGPGQCTTGNCVDFVCCVDPSCPDGEFCSGDDGGICREGTPPPTPTPTPVEVCRGVPCGGDQQCIEEGGRGVCVDVCDGGSLCAVDEACVTSPDGVQSCAVTCTDDCGAEEECVRIGGRGVCVDVCDGSTCQPGERCVDESGGGERCEEACLNFPCPGGESCVIGNDDEPVCAIPCGQGFCEPGEICEESVIGEPLCVRSSRSGGCTIAPNPSSASLWILALLPMALWGLRCAELRRGALGRAARE